MSLAMTKSVTACASPIVGARIESSEGRLVTVISSRHCQSAALGGSAALRRRSRLSVIHYKSFRHVRVDAPQHPLLSPRTMIRMSLISTPSYSSEILGRMTSITSPSTVSKDRRHAHALVRALFGLLKFNPWHFPKCAQSPQPFLCMRAIA